MVIGSPHWAKEESPFWQMIPVLKWMLSRVPPVFTPRDLPPRILPDYEGTLQMMPTTPSCSRFWRRLAKLSARLVSDACSLGWRFFRDRVLRRQGSSKVDAKDGLRGSPLVKADSDTTRSSYPKESSFPLPS